MKFVDTLNVAEHDAFSAGEAGGFLQVFVVLDDIHVALVNVRVRVPLDHLARTYFDDQREIFDVFLFRLD